MPTETITCPITFNSEYVANSVVKVVEFWTLPQESDEFATIYLESCSAFINLLQFKVQKFPTYDGSETETEKINKYYAAEKLSEKVLLRFLHQKQGWTRWRPIAEVTVLNPGRKQQLDFLPRLLTQQSVRLFDKEDALAVQLLDAGNGLIKSGDFIELDFSFSRGVEKKNNTSEELAARIESLELALSGRLTNLSPNVLLGRSAGTGIVEAISQSTFVKPADLNTAISNLAATVTNLAATVTNQLALKAPISNPSFTGFATFGDNVATKFKMIEGTTPEQQGVTISVPLGVSSVSVVFHFCQVEFDTDGRMPAGQSFPGGYEYSTWIDNNVLVLRLAPTNSAAILSKSFKCLIVYKN